MVNKKYRIGYYYEMKVVRSLSRHGYFALRTPGSHSPVDVVAIGIGLDGLLKVKLIQVKATSKEKFSLSNIKKEEREGLIELAKKFLYNDHVSVELWIFYRKLRKKEIIDIKKVILNS